MSDTHQCSIFEEFNSIADESNTLTITLLQDCRGDGCTFSTDLTVINQVLADFSGDPDIKMEVAQDPRGGGAVLTLTDSAQPASTSRVQSNRFGYCERDELERWVWYSRGVINI